MLLPPIGTRSVEFRVVFFLYGYIFIFILAWHAETRYGCGQQSRIPNNCHGECENTWLYHFFQLNSCALWWKIKYTRIMQTHTHRARDTLDVHIVVHNLRNLFILVLVRRVSFSFNNFPSKWLSYKYFSTNTNRNLCPTSNEQNAILSADARASVCLCIKVFFFSKKLNTIPYLKISRSNSFVKQLFELAAIANGWNYRDFDSVQRNFCNFESPTIYAQFNLNTQSVNRRNSGPALVRFTIDDANHDGIRYEIEIQNEQWFRK